MHVNWPRRPSMALANMAGNRFMTFMVGPHLLASSLAHSRKRAREAVEKLRDQRIICSARGERIRVSLAPYNDASDVMKLFRR